MVFNFKRKTIIIASVVCIGVCGAIGGTVAGIYCTGQYTVSDMQTESLPQGTSAESIQESVGESNAAESVQSQTTESQTEEKKEFIKYVEFNVTYAALEKALQIDIKSHEENAEVKSAGLIYWHIWAPSTAEIFQDIKVLIWMHWQINFSREKQWNPSQKECSIMPIIAKHTLRYWAEW